MSHKENVGLPVWFLLFDESVRDNPLSSPLQLEFHSNDDQKATQLVCDFQETQWNNVRFLQRILRSSNL